MKKIILFLIIAAAGLQVLSAQGDNERNKRFWLDIQAGQQIGLNKWSSVGYANDGMPRASVTEIRGVANLNIIKSAVGVFVDMGIGIMPAPNMKSLDLDRMPMPNNGTQYYLRETLSESGPDAASANFKISTGLFGNFRTTEKLNIMPYLGVGGMSVARRGYEMILKEEGSNMQYNTIYEWGVSQSDEYSSSSEMLGYLTARLNFSYRISPKSRLLLGLEYTYFFGTMNFYGRYTNSFNGNIQRAVKVNGNNMNMLGITLGISFR